MYETAATWTIVGPDGTTIIFNDGSSGLYLETVTGFDSPNVRQNVEDIPEFDGAIAGDAYFGSRPITLSGKVAASSAAQRNATVVNMQRALRGLRGDVTLQSQPQGLPAMQTTARLDNVRFTGGYVKDFQIALICPDPRIYSQTLNTGAASGVAATPGASFSLAFPINFGGGSGATVTVNVTNDGNFTTFPVITVHGPAVNPQIRNGNTGESLFLDGLTLATGDYVVLDFSARTVTDGTGANRYSKVRFPGSIWFTLDPGSSAIQLFTSGASAATELDIAWRDAWA